MKRTAMVFTAIALAGQVAAAQARVQTPAEHVALGDRDLATLNYATALKHYEAALASDSMNYDALTRASRVSVDLGEFHSVDSEKKDLYRRAELYARRAVQVRPGDAESHFYLARAIGRNAQSMGRSDRIKFAKVVYDEANAALKINPDHSGALHVLGVWNAEVMRLSGLQRFAAKNLLGGKIFGEANWENAIKHMERAVALDPNRITHHLELAEIYVDRKMMDKAREQLDWIARAPIVEYNDRKYKEIAVELAKKVK